MVGAMLWVCTQQAINSNHKIAVVLNESRKKKLQQQQQHHQSDKTN